MTISLEKLSKVTTVITHAHCPDGMMSALLARDGLCWRSPTPTQPLDIRFIQHGTDEHRNLDATPGMLFVDFAPPVKRADSFVAAGAIVLDHHKTTESLVAQFGENGVFGDEVKDPGVCGATLVYRHVWLPMMDGVDLPESFKLRVEYMTRLAGIRDTWVKTADDWREACKQAEILLFMPKERWLSMTLREIVYKWDADFGWIGDVELEKHEESVTRAAAEAWRCTSSGGTRMALITGGLHTVSDASQLLEDIDLVVAVRYTVKDGKPTLICSTRTKANYDCKKLAEFYGGGGHTKAAGFSVPVYPGDTNPFSRVMELVGTFESPYPHDRYVFPS